MTIRTSAEIGVFLLVKKYIGDGLYAQTWLYCSFNIIAYMEVTRRGVIIIITECTLFTNIGDFSYASPSFWASVSIYFRRCWHLLFF